MTFAAAKLSDIAVINPRLNVKLWPAEPVSFVSMAGLSSETASVVTEQTRLYEAVAKGYTPFLNQDVLLAEITPCFENNKFGQANLSLSVGFGSTGFHVIRLHPDRAHPR